MARREFWYETASMQEKPGIKFAPNDYGKIEQCPYCDKRDIVRINKKQYTCGSASCQAKRMADYQKRRKERGK